MSLTWKIAGKEIREQFRDRRVIFGAFIAPVFMIMLFVLLFGSVENKIKSDPDIKLAIVRDESNAMLAKLEEAQDTTVVMVDSLDEGLALLDESEVRAVLEFSKNFQLQVVQGNAEITAYFDSTRTLSTVALQSVRQMVREMNKEIAAGVLEAQGLSKELASPISLDTKDTGKRSGLGGAMIVAMLPYLIVLWAFYGGFSAVSDMVAGEKERGTLETLMVSPATPKNIVYGKWLALGVICFISSATTLIGVFALSITGLPMTKELFPDGINLSMGSSLAMVLVLISLVAFFAGLLLAVASKAKSIREAQTYLTLVSFMVLLPAIFSQFIEFTDAEKAGWTVWTPILNSAVVLKQAMLENVKLETLGPAVLTSLLLAVVTVWWSVRLYSKETILNRI